MCIPSFFATHHKVVVVGFTDCADEEGGGFECCRGGSYFGDGGDMGGHGTGFYHAGNFGGVHRLTVVDPALLKGDSWGDTWWRRDN
jgi:hypothetical protein